MSIDKDNLNKEEKLKESWQVNLKHFLKSLRSEKGLSQTGLGKILGCSDSTIALLESNKSDNRVISSLIMLNRLGALESKNALHMVKKLIAGVSDDEENVFDQEGLLQCLSEVPYRLTYPFEKKISELYSQNKNEKINQVISIATKLMYLDEGTLSNIEDISEKLKGNIRDNCN
ncbi:MAG: hypothetical protein AB8B73_16090 [Ekhidna sp.]